MLQSLKAWLPHPAPHAAYTGATNGDDPAFFALFAAALAGIGIAKCSMIRSSFPAEDHARLAHAALRYPLQEFCGAGEQGGNV